MGHRLLLSLCTLTIAGASFAQIPNPSFENWTGGLPDGWVTTNLPPIVTPVTRVQPGAAGTYALQGEVVSFAGVSTYPPFVQTIFPIAERPAQLTGSYIFNSVGGDSMYIYVGFYSLTLGLAQGYGELVAPPTGSNFVSFSVPIEFFNASVPDTCIIQFSIVGDDTVHLGSRMVIDNLAFSGTATAVTEGDGIPRTFALEQNYPNPFNPTTTIRYALPEAGRTTLTVSNLLGETVATVVDAVQAAGTHSVGFDAASLPSGMYFYTLRAGKLSETRRMMLLK